MKVLVLNSGSSTVKYQLFETSLELMDTNQDRMLTRGIVDRIGEAVPVDARAVEIALDQLADPRRGVVRKLEEIEAVGHRIVRRRRVF